MSLERDCMKTQVVTDAIELLQEGYPLDEETVKNLEAIGVDYGEFVREFEIDDTI